MSTRFWEVVCAALPVWGVLFGLSIVMLVFVGLSLFLAAPEAGTAQIMVINAALLVILLSFLAGTIRKCRSGDF